VLDEDQRMVGLLQDGHKLEDCEPPADLQSLEPAIPAREDGGVVAADEKYLEPLQVQVAVQCLDEQLPGGHQGREGPGPEGETVERSSKSMIENRQLMGYECKVDTVKRKEPGKDLVGEAH
jgi:hypothetical protein